MKPDTTDNRPEAEKAADAINARDILARGKGKLRVLDGARIALAFYRQTMHRETLGTRSYPHGDQCEKALADMIADLLPSRGPVTVAELAQLFPSIPRHLCEGTLQPHQIEKGARECGSGAKWAARFIAAAFGYTHDFSLAEALAAWDSEHRAAFAQAAAMIATRGI